MDTFIRTLLMLLFTATLFSAQGVAAEDASSSPQSTTDIRILIDVSGSMKWNDPHNLRAPALRLLVGLLPDGAKAGVWTFGQYVNMLVPLDEVDSQWKATARQASTQIHAKGLFTNIEETLRRATWDWEEPDPESRRSLIILTDGIVDISENDAEDDASRRRILNSILPQFQEAGVTVYTIALSGGADERLLTQLAAGTSGWHEQIDSTDTLERIFLRMFEKAAQRDSLPLVDNEVKVDESIEELTLLVFRNEGAQPSRVTTPVNETFGQSDAPENVRWHHEDRYDLITIDQPVPGKWKIQADVDPDNRVMVVTDLKLRTSRLPNDILMGKQHPLTVRLTEQGETITRQEFHKFIDAGLTQSHKDGQTWEWPLKDDGSDADQSANDGIYTVSLEDSLTPGRHELRVFVDGITFQRQSRQLINVHSSPVITTIKPDNDQSQEGQDKKPPNFILSVIPRTGLIDPETMIVNATVTDPAGNTRDIEIPRTHHNEWLHTFDTSDLPGKYKVALNVSAEKGDGETTTYKIGQLTFGAESEEPPAPQSPAPAVQDEPKAEPETTKDAPEQNAAPAEPASQEQDWGTLVTAIIGINVFLLGAAYLIYRRMRGRTEQSIEDAEGELS